MPNPLNQPEPSQSDPSDSALVKTDQTSSELVKAEPSSLSLKQKTGDAAERWLAKNRSLVLRQTPFWAQSMAGILIGLGALAVLGGVLFRIDEVVTVQGQLESIGGTVDVKTPAGGQVAEVFFNDGDQVEKGQLLVRFDTRQAADEKATLMSLIELEGNELKSRLKTLASQQLTLQGRLAVLQQKLSTKKMIIEELEQLVLAGGFQKLQFLEQKDQVFELQKQLSEVTQQQDQLRLQADQTRLEARKSVGQMQNQLRTAELQLQYQNVVAPVKGVVFDPKAYVEGVIGAGERILSIVPQSGLYAEVFVPNKDIGFVKKGQQAKVRVDAFPFTRYGELEGKVTQIAADALPPDKMHPFYRFPVKLKFDKPYLESRGIKIPLQSGMAVTSNLKLRDKRVISLISDLMVDQMDSVKSLRQQ